MPQNRRPLTVFLCHARGDKVKAREMYDTLRRCQIQPWLDVEDLLPGQDWQSEIPSALARSDSIIILLSKGSVTKEGFFQKEIKFALDRALEMPEGRIFLIPARLQDCNVPPSLQRYQWVDLFEKEGQERLLRSLQAQADHLRRAKVKAPPPVESEPKASSWHGIGANQMPSWLGYDLGPSVLFWVASLGLYISRVGWQEVLESIQALSQSPQGSWMIPAFLVGFLLVIFASSALMQVFRTPILRLLEGYWPWPFNYLGLGIVSLQRIQLQKKYEELRKLRGSAEFLDGRQRERLAWVEYWTHWRPAVSSELLPTAIGNILRARERSPERKYGLDTTLFLPLLLSLIPENTRTDFAKARSSLDQLIELWFVGLVFLIWTFFTPRAALISLVWMIVVYGMVKKAAMNYGNLLEAVFDHRLLLYDKLGLKRPKNIIEEKYLGYQLTEFYWRGGTPPESLVYGSEPK